MNFQNGTREIPAGMEIKVRTTGSSLPIKVDHDPNRLKNLSAISRSCFEMRTYLPYRSINGLPPYMPKKYVNMEPTTLPRAPANATPNKEKLPCQTKKPANGIIISLGNGIAADSIFIKTATT